MFGSIIDFIKLQKLTFILFRPISSRCTLMGAVSDLVVALLALVFSSAEAVTSIVTSVIHSLGTSVLQVLQPFTKSIAMPSMLKRLLWLFQPKVQEGTAPEKVFQLPVFQRRDGATIKLGYLVKRTAGGEDSWVVKGILVKSFLGQVTLKLGLLKDGSVMEEELECGVEEVSCVAGRQVVLGLARDGMADIAASIARYPEWAQRQVRRHQLASALRREVQRFLGGCDIYYKFSLGCVDWRLDPGVLGLERETDFSLEHGVEGYVGQESHLDFLLGRGWDYRAGVGGDGLRIIINLELVVDLNQELRVSLHGIRCSVEGDVSPRRAWLSQRSQAETTPMMAQKMDGGDATLAWDEYQPASRECSPRRHIPSATVSMEDLLLTGSYNTSTAITGLDKLLSAIPSSKMVFDTSPIQEVERGGRCLGTSTGSLHVSSLGPNTSTPADELGLEGDGSHKFGLVLSRDSSPSLQDDTTAELRLGLAEAAEEEVKKRLSGHFNMTDLMPAQEEEEPTRNSREESEDEKNSLLQHSSEKPTFLADHEINENTEHEQLSRRICDKPVAVTRCVSDLKPDSTLASSLATGVPHHDFQDPGASSASPLEDGDMNLSIASSHSLASRHSDLSSLSGVRVRGLFRGTALQSSATVVCPFPAEWRAGVPEVIENDEDID